MATGTLVDVVMPQMGVSVSEGTITRWAKAVGETIEADETIVEISTDKVDTEIPSPATGVVQRAVRGRGRDRPREHPHRGDRHGRWRARRRALPTAMEMEQLRGQAPPMHRLRRRRLRSQTAGPPQAEAPRRLRMRATATTAMGAPS